MEIVGDLVTRRELMEAGIEALHVHSPLTERA
jgi:hypothetical protein